MKFSSSTTTIPAKYELVDQGHEHEGTKLFRIRALRNFGDVYEADWGGLVEGEHNLSHNGNCWIHDDATVKGNAVVRADAQVLGNDTLIYGNAVIGGAARITDAVVRDYAYVAGCAKVWNAASIRGNAEVYERAKVSGATIKDHAMVFGSAQVREDAVLGGDNQIGGQDCYRGTDRANYKELPSG